MKTERLRLIVIQAIILIVLVFIFLSAVFILPYNRKIPTALILLSVLLAFPIWLEKKPPIVTVLFILTVFYAISWGKIIEGPWYFNEYLYLSLESIIIGLFLTKRHISRWVMILPLLVILFTVLIAVVFLNESTSDGSFLNMNRNALAMFVVLYGMMNTIIEVKQSRGIPSRIPPIISLFVCFYSQSRAGLLISILYLLATMWMIIYKIIRARSGNEIYHFTARKKILLLVVITSLLILVVLFVVNSRFKDVGIASSGRIEIFKSFFQEINLQKFLTGFKPSILESMPFLHNSFLDLLAGAGISAFIFFIVTIAGLITLYKKSLMFFLLLVCLLIYAQVEHIIFLRFGDFVLYPLLIYAFEDFTFPKLKRKASTS